MRLVVGWALTPADVGRVLPAHDEVRPAEGGVLVPPRHQPRLPRRVLPRRQPAVRHAGHHDDLGRAGRDSGFGRVGGGEGN